MIYTIGDLHLSFKENKPMNIFGKNWENHEEKIKKDWEEKVTDKDLVVLPRRLFVGNVFKRFRRRF